MAGDPIKQALDAKTGSWSKLLADQAGFTPDEAQKFVPAALDKVAGLVRSSQDSSAPLDAQKVLSQLNPPELAKRAGVDPGKATAGLRTLLPEVGRTLKAVPEAKGFVESAKGLLGQLGQQGGRS